MKIFWNIISRWIYIIGRNITNVTLFKFLSSFSLKLYFISGLIAVLPIKPYYKRQKELKLISSLFRSLLKLEPVYTLHVIDLCGFINDICPRQAALNQESQYETLSKTVHKVTEFSCQEWVEQNFYKNF